jgi:hypothetical protein
MAATVQEKIKPSGFWYVIALVLLVVGPIVGTVMVVLAFVNAYDELSDFPSVPIDGGGEINLDAGDYTVYAEGPGVDTFTVFSSSDVEILDPAGEPVGLSFVSGDFSYSAGGDDGIAALTFTAPTDGAYQVNPVESTSRSSNITDIAIGPGFGDVLGDQVGLIIVGSAIGTIGFILGLIMLIVVAVKRGKRKRERRLAVSASYGTGYGGPGSPAYGQPGYPPPPGAGVPPPGVTGWEPPGQSPIS